VIFTATVTTPGTGAPSGSVTFLDGTTVLGSGTLNGTFQASFIITSLPNGPQSITAVYSGDTADLASTSVAITQNVQAVTDTPLTSSSNPSLSGQSINFVATIEPTGSFTPTGTVTFEDNGGSLGTTAVSTSGGVSTATLTTSSLTAGTHPIAAAYSGDSNNAASTSPTLQQIVEATTSVTLATGGSPSLLGNSVTFSASVPATVNGQPSGTVSFLDNGNQIGSTTLDGSGNASFATSILTLGSHPITAVYSGDALDAASTSTTKTQVVLEPTQVAVLSSVNPSQPGASVIFTASVTTTGPGTPTGTMTFNDGVTPLGTETLSTTAGITTATLATTSLALGVHSITAVYGGDVSNAPAPSPAFIQNVAQTTTVGIVSGTNPAIAGTLVVITATVTPADGTTPTGTVTFKQGAIELGTETLNGSGVASISISSLAPGQYSITAVYSGDIDSSTNTSTMLTQIIQQTTTTALSVDVNPSIAGNTITLTATVTPAISGTPTGTVTYMEGATTLGTKTLNASGTTALMLSTLAPGSHTIIAVYQGDAVNLTSPSPAITQVVEENTSVNLTPSSNPVPYGVFVIFTATVVPTSSGMPTGTVTFMEGSVTLGTTPLNGSGVATFATGSLGTGSHTITANYGGDADNLPNTGLCTLTVSQAVPVITWPAPAAITYGTTLSVTQLNATAVPSGGTFAYTPGLGSTPVTGSNTLSVTYTPLDTTDYGIATGTVTLMVNKATPTVSWTTPAAITFGTVLSATQLDASPSVPGTPVYTPLAGTTPATGTDTLSVTYTPTDTTDYNNFSGSVQLVVGKATPTVSWTTPAAITFGTVLSSTQLDASPSVPGTSVYSPAAGTIPAAGTDTLSVTFTPTDTTDYNNFTGTVQLTVNKVAPTITWTTPAAITYGAVLSVAQLDASAVPSGGTYVYTPALGSTPAAGRDTLSVTYTPPDTTDYSNATGTVTLAVNQAAPVITWATPAAIPYGTVLSATQLDASAVPSGGTYVYTPALGSIPAMGSDTLSVTYTPPDTTDYTTATATVNLTVTANSSPITPTISWATPAAVASGTALSSAQLNAIASVAGITVDGTFVYSPAAGTIPAIGLDTLTVVFTPTDSVDYATATGSVILTVGDFFSLNFGSSPIQTVQQGANASYSFTVTPVGLAKLPGVVTFTATGLPPDATITFSPSTVPAGSAATEVAITIHTSSAQAANTGTSQGSKGPAALGMLLLPILGIVGLRKRLGKIPQLRAAVVLGVLSLGAIMGLTGCGAICTIGPQPTSTTYTVVITAHCGALQHSADVTIKVEN
jgi:Bacterial Ig-like domain (group 3)